MKELKLNVPERLVALGIFNNPQNKVATSELKVYLDDVGKFRLTLEEKAAVKWEDITNNEGEIISVKWNEEGVEPKAIEIDEFVRAFLQEKLEKLEGSAADPLALSIVSLLEKVK